jgi:hypothetical protein
MLGCSRTHIKMDYSSTPSIPWFKVYSFLWKIPEYKVYREIVGLF